MFRHACLSLLILPCLLPSVAIAQDEKEAVISYEDHIKPIFREHCVACHAEGDANGGLSVESYAGVMAGGSGGASVQPSDASASRLFQLVSHTAQPTMPPDEDKIDAAKIELLKTWIDQGCPENSGSEIKRKSVSVAAVKLGDNGRPEGPPPMPGESMLLEVLRETQQPAACAALAASPWSPLVAVGGQYQVCLYDSRNGQLVGVLPFPEGQPQSITFSRDGKLVLVGGGTHAKNGVAVLYDVTDGRRITQVGDEIDIVMAADISDDNSKIAIAGPKRIVRIYDSASGEQIHELRKHTDWIYALRFTPDGILLASGDRSGGLVVWETDTGRIYQDLIGHKGEIRTLDWRPDSMVLYSGSLDKSIKMWDMNNGAQIKSFDAHGGVTALDVCNDGSLVSTGRDGTVRLWTAAGDAAGELKKFNESGLEVALGVDGSFVAAGDWTGEVRLWDRTGENKAKPEPKQTLQSNPPSLQTQLALLDPADQSPEVAAKREQIQNYLVRTQNRMQELKAAEQALSEQIAAAAAGQASATAQAKSHAADLAAVQMAAQTSQAKLDELVAQLAQLQQQVDAQKAMVDQHRQKQQATEAAIAEATKQAETAAAQAQTLQAELEAAKAATAEFLQLYQ